MKRLRVYIDTSVVGGVLDTEFFAISARFFDMVRSGQVTLLVSDLLIEELEGAPESVRNVMSELPQTAIEPLRRDPESRALRDAYLEADVVGSSSLDDAFHVAIATVAQADLIVSWNFKHFVNIEKIRGFNAVNIRHGYGLVDIRSPQEVAPHDEG